ncbi:MAG TPA: CoA transferase subunit A [Syntrophomonadaceae bacterium]|jgi:acetate CoA/acetoacetate CoA-transferase alpha subunit|nr:CoA transferase subunit A [Syntrophomonadaceae bacterium]HRX21169.1 CoA transferase subunit A [Syntrophomonadaceae bacterium]
MPKITDAATAIKQIKNGDTVMIGGFMAVGTPENLVDTLIEQGTGDLTVICNDTGFIGIGIGKLIVDHRITELMASHIGTNPETGRQMNAGEIKVTLMPQGTLAERIRAGGYGLGGVLTPTGFGTVVEEGKKTIEIEGVPYLLELPIKADYALLHAKVGDKAGNLMYHGTMYNFNPVMAMAANTVIAEVDEILEDSFLPPDSIHTPGIVVDYLVKKAW